MNPSPVVRLNRSVAVSMTGRNEEALAIVDELLADGGLAGYRYLQLSRGEFLVRLDRYEEALGAYRNAVRLSENQVDRSFAGKKLADLQQRLADGPGPSP